MQLQKQDWVLGARRALAKAEILRTRDKRTNSTHKPGIMDTRKI